MASITKKVSSHVPGNDRYQVWTSSENADDGTPIAAGDRFEIASSLGRPARKLTLEVTGASDLVVRINSRVKRFAKHLGETSTGVHMSDTYDNLASPVWVDTNSTNLTIGGASSITWTFDKEIAIRDLAIVTWSTGTFRIISS